MKRLGILLALALVLVSSCNAVMRVRATAPALDNDGTCTAPVNITIAANAPRVMHFAWSGVVSGEDSIFTTAGQPVVLVKLVPPGAYAVRAWASDAGGPGCDTTITVTVKAPPAKPALGP